MSVLAARFLFNPPVWDVPFGRPVEELLKTWPEEVDEAQRSVFLNLLTYSVYLTIAEKEWILKSVPLLAKEQVTGLLDILIEERRKFLGLSGVHYWDYLNVFSWWGRRSSGGSRQPLRPRRPGWPTNGWGPCSPVTRSTA